MRCKSFQNRPKIRGEGTLLGAKKKRQNRKPQSAGLYMFNICISVQLSVPFVCLSFDEDEST